MQNWNIASFKPEVHRKAPEALAEYLSGLGFKKED